MHVIVVADGDPPERAVLDAIWPGWSDDARLVIAADGGVRGAVAIGRRPDLVVGDLDSVDATELAALASEGVTVEQAPVDKDETDTELALLAAIARGATRLTILGAFGGPRLDHELANLGLLALPALRERSAVLLDPRARVRLIQAPGSDGGPMELVLPGPVGAIVSLVPFGSDVQGVTTSGLRYPLTDDDLPCGPARGLSNVRLTDRASIRVRRGRLLVIEGPPPAATLRP